MGPCMESSSGGGNFLAWIVLWTGNNGDDDDLCAWLIGLRRGRIEWEGRNFKLESL